MTDLKINETIFVTNTIAGTLEKYGNYKGTTFISSSRQWEDVVVQAKFKILLSEGTAIANSKENILILPTGTKMKLSENYGFDAFKGETIWTNNHFTCEVQDLNVLYDDPASFIILNAINDFSNNIYTYIVDIMFVNSHIVYCDLFEKITVLKFRRAVAQGILTNKQLKKNQSPQTPKKHETTQKCIFHATRCQNK